jgi:hypothetical protein
LQNLLLTFRVLYPAGCDPPNHKAAMVTKELEERPISL